MLLIMNLEKQSFDASLQSSQIRTFTEFNQNPSNAGLQHHNGIDAVESG
uniref:Uncharacterized protein n=1 Tax=Arundo donax TaxID=35708 RepID=A0A0A9E9C6_ARUDO